MSDSPVGYNPFKMKAGKASGYDNSPMKKNYGQFGVGTSEMPQKPTPNKFFGGIMGMMGGKVKEMMEKRKNDMAAKQMEGAAGGGDVQAMDQQTGAMEDPAAAAGEEAGEAAGGASAGDVPVHGSEAHKEGGMMGKLKGMLGKGGFVSGMFSDVRLKEKIEKTGISPSGIPIYEFNYIGSNNRYSGAMAQDLLEINPNAVMLDASGYYKVNYNNIDVDMRQIN
jgi:hypothetical protein